MSKTKDLSCGDIEASSHGEGKEERRGEEGGIRRETKPVKFQNSTDRKASAGKCLIQRFNNKNPKVG